MQPLISVIVPIYNVENYLSVCIESLIHQSYKNIEIILVNDGSTDGCELICSEYKKLDSRIIVINKKNGGLSESRNEGMKLSNGEYLMFVDSDDYISLDCIEYLYNLLITNNSNLAIGGVEKFDDSTDKTIWSTFNGKELIDIYSKEEAIKDMLINGCASWGRLYERKTHENILFPLGEINEDEAIVIKILDKCDRVIKTNRVVYKYRYRRQSITSTAWHLKKMDWYFHAKENYKFISFKYCSLKKYARYRYCLSIIWCLNNMTINKNLYASQIELLKRELKSIFLSVLNERLLSSKEIIRCFLLIYFYGLYSMIIKCMGKHYT